MDKIKRFIDIYVPVTTCTLRCKYCYITTHRLFGGPLPVFKYSPEHVRQALSKDRLGGTCLLNFCAGGETLLAPHLLDYVRALLEEGHYVMIVTNATCSKRFDEIALFPKALTKHLFFKVSYHYTQLKERGMLDVFFKNVRKVRDAGCSFTLEQTPFDEDIPIQDEIINRAIKELGAVPHITVARDERVNGELPILTELSRDEYAKVWGEKYHSSLFDFKLSIFEKKRKEFCYAGEWSAYLNLLTGRMSQCYISNFTWNVFEDVSKPIPFCALGHHCHLPHCYNGHAWLALGVIPELKTPTYGDLRNRICEDGSEWLQPEMKQFMNTKLPESNVLFTFFEKLKVDVINDYVEVKRAIKRRFFR